MRRRFATLDVFTDQRFVGNPLAVVLESAGLDEATMQRIAREFNLSETVFVGAPENASHRARLRIFTPARELPFAGHPTVGTAVLLARLDGGAAAGGFVLEEQIGPVRCRVTPAGPDAGYAEFDLPRSSTRSAGALDIAAMAASLGLTPADCAVEGLPVERWSAGNPFTFLSVRGLAIIGRCQLDLARFGAAFGGGDHAAAFVFCRETVKPGNAFHARMFAPGMGVVEDPATGSAVAAFSGYLAAHGGYGDGDHLIRIEQGYEMGRPSSIALTMKISGGELAGAAIGGDAVVVTEGVIEA